MTLVISVLSVFAVLACHWLGLLLIRPAFHATLARLGPRGTWGEDLSLAVTILMLVLWLFLDIALCAGLTLVQKGDIGFTKAFVFAIANFTTVGAAAPSQSELWNLAGPLTAMCGVFIFGWTTSFLVEGTHTVREFRAAARAAAITNR